MRSCIECGELKPLNSEFFGHTPNGNFRNQCRKCRHIKNAEWADNNPLAVQDKWERQNEKRSRAGAPWTSEDIAEIRSSLNDKCDYCGINLDGGGEVDHITSLDHGGTNERSNLTLACLPCNRAKGARSVEDYLRYRQWLGLPIRKNR